MAQFLLLALAATAAQQPVKKKENTKQDIHDKVPAGYKYSRATFATKQVEPEEKPAEKKPEPKPTKTKPKRQARKRKATKVLGD